MNHVITRFIVELPKQKSLKAFWQSLANLLGEYYALKQAFFVIDEKLEKNPMMHHYEFSPLVHFHAEGDIVDFLKACQLLQENKPLLESLVINQARLEEREYLLQILDGIRAFVAMKDLSGNIVYANKLANQSLSRPGESIMGKNITELYPPEEVKKIQKYDQKIFTNQQLISTELKMYTKDGYIQAQSNRFGLLGYRNEINRVASVSYDITENKKNRERLDHSLAFQNVLMSIATRFINVQEEYAKEAIEESLSLAGELIHADRIYVFDYDFTKRVMKNTYEWCSSEVQPQIEELQAVPMDEFLENWVYPHQRGETVFFPIVEELDHDSAIYQILHMQDIKSVLTIPLLYENTLYGFVGFDAVKDLANWSEEDLKLLKVLSEMIINVKIREQVQHQLRIASVRAEEASLAKGDFLANMSHEIRTPLSGIYNSLYLLINTELTSEQQEYVEIAKTSMEAISGIVNNVLDLSRIEAGKLDLDPVPFFIEDELYQIVKTQEYSAHEKGISIEINHDYSIPASVLFDRLRLRQILLNLMHNAVKYTEKGVITLQSKMIDLSATEVSVEFSVKDTGIGIHPEQITKITDKFYQAEVAYNRLHSGSGLGLAIVKQLVELFGGQLKVSSKLGHGSMFRFTINLPIYQAHHPNRFQELYGKRCLVFLQAKDIRPQMREFFQSMNMIVDFCEQHPDETIQKGIDYFFFHHPYQPKDLSVLDEIKKRFGHQESIRILCYPSSFVYHQEQVQPLGYDFILTLPTTRQKMVDLFTTMNSTGSAESKKPNKDWQIEPSFVGYRVLIVDDNRINRQSMDLILRHAGFRVTLAQDGQEALKYSQSQVFDLILMDVQMPIMDGYEATKHIRQTQGKNQHVPIIALTANALISAKEKALQAGMNDSLTKPIKPDVMFRLFAQLLFDHLEQPTNHLSAPPISTSEMAVSFDYQDFQHRFIGSQGVEVVIIKTFLEEVDEDILRLETAIHKRDWSHINQAAHYLKGSTSYVSAIQAMKICQSILDATNKQDEKPLESLFQSLQEEIKRWKQAVVEYYETELNQEETRDSIE